MDPIADPPKPSVDRTTLPPGPSELPIIGQAFRLRSDLLGLMQDAATYGDISTVSVNPLLICLVNSPKLNEEVLVTNHHKMGRGRTAFGVLSWLMGDSVTTSNGTFHMRQRRLIQSQLQRTHIKKYAESMTDFSSQLAQSWSDGAELDIEKEMRDLTLRIFVKALFGVELADMVRRIGAAFEGSNSYMQLRLTQPPFLREFLHRLPLPSARRFRRGQRFLDEAIYDLIKMRRQQSDVESDDLLSMLLQARYKDAEGGEDSMMSDRQVRDELVSLYIAGHEPTASLLTWCFYLLAKHPEIEARLHAEVDDVLAGRPASLDDLPNLTFTDKVITETLRLYPSTWALGRMVFQPVELGGYQIPPGTTVMISPLITQRDSRWFDDPLAFRPERWTPEFRETLPRYAYIPLGGGPHDCIGGSFALMTATIALATLTQRWRVRQNLRHEAVIQPHLVLTAKGGMPITIERRS